MISKEALLKDVQSLFNKQVGAELQHIELKLKAGYAGSPISIPMNNTNLSQAAQDRVIEVLRGAGWTVKHEPGGYDQRDNESWPGRWIIS